MWGTVWQKDTKLENLSKAVHMLVEEIRISDAEGLDRIFMEVYSQHAGRMTDSRQQSKVKHALKDILGIVFFGVLAGNDEWEDIYDFAVDERETLRNYLDLKNGIPSHDTMQRVFAIIKPGELQGYAQRDPYSNGRNGRAAPGPISVSK